MPHIIPTDWTAVEFFNPHEFACKCGCSTAAMDFNFILMLNKMRKEFGKPIRISSGFRCPTWNDLVSKTGRHGPHTTGLASDIRVNGHDAHAIISLALMMGATGIGVAQKGPHETRYIHVDVMPVGERRPWIWSY